MAWNYNTYSCQPNNCFKCVAAGGIQMITDIKTLPELSEEYQVSEEQSHDFKENGHILLRNVASRAEVSAYQPFISAALQRHNKETRALADRDTYHKAFIQVGNLWEVDEAVKRFVMARRFARVAADLMGVTGVRLYHDQALFKEGGGGPTPWHQDQYYWPLDTDNTVTMWMPLVNVPVEMGILSFATGSHSEGPKNAQHISEQSDAFYQKLVEEKQMTVSREGMSAGDATFHYGWTIHGAPGNDTDKAREVMTVIYYADGARITEPDNEHRPKDLERWFPGQKPGEIAASPINPLLYQN
jgi:ectoine hydroxylase-related dioxygenase (phytanoyl-CoA dioxygenase family)